MKKRNRKIVYILAIISCIILTTIFSNNKTSLNPSDIFTVEALAAGENINIECSDGRGFCIINGWPINGVTYKE